MHRVCEVGVRRLEGLDRPSAPNRQLQNARGDAHLRPNSMSVSLRYSPSCSRKMSPRLSETAPAPSCGQTSMLTSLSVSASSNAAREETYTSSGLSGADAVGAAAAPGDQACDVGFRDRVSCFGAL